MGYIYTSSILSSAVLHSSDDGASWTAQNTGATPVVNAVWGSGPGDVFAVGQMGTILQYSDPLAPVAVEIPGQGVWRYEDATGWRQLTPANASQVGVDRARRRGRGDPRLRRVGATRTRPPGRSWTPPTPRCSPWPATASSPPKSPASACGRYEDATAGTQLTPAEVSGLDVDARGDAAVAIPGAAVGRFEDAVGCNRLWNQPTQDASQAIRN